MTFVTLALIMAGLGALGGLANGFLPGKNLEMPRVQKSAGVTLLKPGFLGDMITGAIAATVTWGAYGPFASANVLGDPGTTVTFTATAGQVLGALVTGMGGARILSAEVDKRALTRAASTAAAADGDETVARQIATASPEEALELAEQLPDAPG